MKVAIVTMFSGLSSTYSLVNVVADQIQMLLQADIPVKVLVSETCPDSDRTGIFLDQRIEWVKVTMGKISHGTTTPMFQEMCMKHFFRKPM